MKKLFCVFCLCCVAQAGMAQVSCRIDPRFELTSIAFRLAGAQEYTQCGVPVYSRSIDDYFLQYAEHPLVQFIRQIRRDYGIGYDAVSTTADWLCIASGTVGLQPGYDPSRVGEGDSRWTEAVFRRYLKLLDDFYRETKFAEFFEGQQELYRYAERQLDTLLLTLDPGWFERFYGQKFGNPDIYIGLCNGPNNYALTKRNEGYGIVVGCGCDQNGRPAYNPLFLTIVLHELAHNYSNPLGEKCWPQMQEAAHRIYPYVADKMARNAYGDARSMTMEWLNELFVIMAYREMQPQYVDWLVKTDQYRGWIWMDRAVKLMDEFYADRARYPHIEEFMPRIVAFFEDIGHNFEQILTDYNSSMPHVTKVLPAVGSVTPLEEAPSELAIRFSEPMNTGMFGANQIEREGIILIPLDKPCYWRDAVTLVYPLKKDALEHGKTYGIKLLSFAIQSAKGFPIPSDVEIIFRIE